LALGRRLRAGGRHGCIPEAWTSLLETLGIGVERRDQPPRGDTARLDLRFDVTAPGDYVVSARADSSGLVEAHVLLG
jgi:hypothetical protein